MAVTSTGPKILSAQERVAYYQTKLNPFLADDDKALMQHMQFLKEGTNTQKLAAAACTFFFIGGGAYVGGEIGSEIGKSISGLIDDEDGKDTGSLIGRGIGAVLGMIGGFIGLKHISKKDVDFIKWRNDQQQRVLDLHTALHYSNDLHLTQFICQLTQNVTTAPARLPTGYLVEYDQVDKLQIDKEGKIECPFTRQKFMKVEVKLDYERALFVNKRVLVLIRQDLEAAKENPDQKIILANMEANLKNSVEICYQHCVLDIEKQRINNVISASVSQARRTDFFETFGEKSEAPLDWNLDWKSLLDNRWKARNPGCKLY